MELDRTKSYKKHNKKYYEKNRDDILYKKRYNTEWYKKNKAELCKRSKDKSRKYRYKKLQELLKSLLKNIKIELFPDYEKQKMTNLQTTIPKKQVLENLNLVIVRKLFQTVEGTEFYCSEIYDKSDLSISNKEILSTPLQFKMGENFKTYFCLESKEYAIPAGTYPIKEDNSGKFKFFKLFNVPNRRNIEIHEGNYIRQTLGCLLFGGNFDHKRQYKDKDLIITNSKFSLELLRNKTYNITNEFVGTIAIFDNVESAYQEFYKELTIEEKT